MAVQEYEIDCIPVEVLPQLLDIVSEEGWSYTLDQLKFYVKGFIAAVDKHGQLLCRFDNYHIIYHRERQTNLKCG